MEGLYEAIGRISSAAHATSDDIDENSFPNDDNNERHGLDIFHRGHYIQFRAVPTEPKFIVGSPLSIASRLKDQYSPSQVDERVDVDFATLSPENQEEILETVLRSDLEAAAEHEEAFRTALHEQVLPRQEDILRMTYGEDELWNGVFIRDHCFPHHESFNVTEYREIVERIRTAKVAIGTVMSETLPPLRSDYVEKNVEPELKTSQPDSIAFY